MKETMLIRQLEQVRLLSDPLKLRLIQSFAEGEKTTGQVAAELKQRVTRLYRHVDALHEAGLLEIVRETPKRGTVERSFRAVARRFEVDQSLFSQGGKAETAHAVRDVLRAGEDEILEAIMRDDETGMEPMVLRLRGRNTPANIEKLRRSLEDWIESAQREGGEVEDTVGFGAMIAFYSISEDDGRKDGSNQTGSG